MSVTRRVIIITIAVVALLVATPVYLRRNSAAKLLNPNSPPVAVDDSYTVHASLLISPMQNDYDPDPGDTTTFQGITTQPQHGALNWTNVGTYNYVPVYGYLGPDSFTYSICDSHGACATGTVNISVVNQPPVANTDSYTVHASRVIVQSCCRRYRKS